MSLLLDKSSFVINISAMNSRAQGLGTKIMIVNETPRFGGHEHYIEGEFHFTGLFLPVEVACFQEYLQGENGEALFDVTALNKDTGRCLRHFANCRFISGDLEVEDITTILKNARLTFDMANTTIYHPPKIMDREAVSIIDNEEKGAEKTRESESNTVEQQLQEAKQRRKAVWKSRPINW